MQATIEVSGSMILTYDENSKEFIESFDSYKDVINSTGKISDMLEQIAYSITKNGVYSMIEGIGYVSTEHFKPDSDSYCGVYLEKDFDLFSYHINK